MAKAARTSKLKSSKSLGAQIEALEARQLLAGDLIGHWNATDLTEIEDGAEVGTWTDSVGSVSATSNTESGIPKFVQNGIGGRPSFGSMRPMEWLIDFELSQPIAQ